MAEPNETTESHDVTSFPADGVPRPAADYLTEEERRELAALRRAVPKDQTSPTGLSPASGAGSAITQSVWHPGMRGRRKRD
jgi:hypothetical protein